MGFIMQRKDHSQFVQESSEDYVKGGRGNIVYTWGKAKIGKNHRATDYRIGWGY